MKVLKLIGCFIGVFIFTFLMGIFMFWCSGWEFERSHSLGFIVFMSITISTFLSVKFVVEVFDS